MDLKGIEKVKGYSGQQVEQEPAFDVVNGDQFGVVHDLAALTDVGRPEVEDDVCEYTPEKKKKKPCSKIHQYHILCKNKSDCKNVLMLKIEMLELFMYLCRKTY